jgi:hypothetical protein
MSRKKTPSTDPSSARSERLRAQSKDELVALLDELAAKHPEVEARLARHALVGDPAALAAQFRQRLQAWKKSTRFRPRSAAAAFGRELESWLDEIERELLPLDAARAHALADAFVCADAQLFEQADDSDGAIGDAVRAGCRLWLVAAKAQPDREPAHWIDRIYTLVNADEYGAREALLRHADILLAPADLRTLASRFEDDLERALARRAGDRTGYPVYKAAAAVGLVADALRDPDLSTKTTLRYSPAPNPLQKEQFVERYLRFGRPAEALVWLEGDWERHEDLRERLLAQTHGALNDAGAVARGPPEVVRSQRVAERFRSLAGEPRAGGAERGSRGRARARAEHRRSDHRRAAATCVGRRCSRRVVARGATCESSWRRVLQRPATRADNGEEGTVPGRGGLLSGASHGHSRASVRSRLWPRGRVSRRAAPPRPPSKELRRLAHARNIRGRVAQYARTESRVLEPTARLTRLHGGNCAATRGTVPAVEKQDRFMDRLAGVAAGECPR